MAKGSKAKADAISFAEPAEGEEHFERGAPSLPWVRSVKLTGNGTPWSQTDAFVSETGDLACHVLHDGNAAGIEASNTLLRGANALATINNLFLQHDLRMSANKAVAEKEIPALLSRIRDLIGQPDDLPAQPQEPADESA